MSVKFHLMLLEEVIEFENGSMQLQLIFIKLQNRVIFYLK